MSYEPTEWQSGDVVTSAKLNKLEQGVAAAGGASVLVVNVANIDGNITCDKTASEMLTAYESGVLLIRSATGNARKYNTVTEAGDYGEDGFAFSIYQVFGGDTLIYSCANGTDYPVLETSN